MPGCVPCSNVGNYKVSQINLPANPRTIGKKTRPNSINNIPGTSGSIQNKSRKIFDNAGRRNSTPPPAVISNTEQKKYLTPSFLSSSSQDLSNQPLDRPKYIFSKNEWTFEKEQALEKLLMK